MTPLQKKKQSTRKKAVAQVEGVSSQFECYAGLSLGGGKTDRTALVVIEYYPDYHKLFVRRVYSDLGSEREMSPDFVLHDLLSRQERDITLISIDAPLSLPKCMRCKLVCPGYETCKEPEIKWLSKIYDKKNESKRPHKVFTPYTERCAEAYIASSLEEVFHPSHALGSNTAPLLARAHYVLRRLQLNIQEFYPKLTLWRIGQSLKIQKSYLRFHRHTVDSEEARHFFLKRLMEEKIIFIYQQDLKLLVENPNVFDALLGALNSYLFTKGQTEKPPKDYPKNELWISFPKLEINW